MAGGEACDRCAYRRTRARAPAMVPVTVIDAEGRFLRRSARRRQDALRLHLNSGTAEQTSIDLYSCLFDECTVARPVGGLAAYELGDGQRQNVATELRHDIEQRPRAQRLG